MQIHNLPPKKRAIALAEYEARRRKKGNAYLCRWFGFFRAYTGQYFLLLLYRISIILIIGIFWQIHDLFVVSDFVNKKNAELDNELMLKYE